VNDHQTTVLTARLHQLADDLTPPLDVVEQVRAARARHRRTRRTRIGFLALATATAALVIGTATSIHVLASPEHQVAGPGVTTTEAPAPPTSDREQLDAEARAAAAERAARDASVLPAGWEARSFHGITFGVPAGARMADDVQVGPTPTFVWNGPLLSAGDPSFITIEIAGDRSAFPDSLPAYESFPIRGAEQAWMSFDTTEETTLHLEIGSVERYIHVEGRFPSGEVGLQIGRLFMGSIAVGAPDGASPGPPGAPLADGEHFAVVHDFDLAAGAMTLEPAEWLGEGRTWSCAPESPAPDGTVDDVTDFCVGARESLRTVPVAADRFVLYGTPPRSVDAGEFAAEVDRLVDDQVQGPLMGWFTVRNGAIVEFQQTPRQGA
jgi:hypothetical protein